VIGVITSPTGAVIRDILHRLSDRFPRRVLLWPVAVQAMAQPGKSPTPSTDSIGCGAGGPVPRPDLLIVARGAARSRIYGRSMRKSSFAPPRRRKSVDLGDRP